MNAKEQLLEKFYDGTFAGKTDKEICKELKISGREKLHIRNLLHELCDEGKLVRDFFFHYGTAQQLGAIKGKISAHERGFGFLIPEDEKIGHDFFIPARFMHGAYHKDTVLCVPVKDAQSDDEVEVISILERGMTETVGTFYREKNFGFLRPDEKKFTADIYIPLGKSKNCTSGMKAVAKITDYPKDKAPGGEIIEILTADSELQLEELSIIRSYSLHEEFPVQVLKEAARQEKKTVTQEDIFSRQDFRDRLIITIDGEDTRDIDDAVSVEYDDGIFTLGVHIADVSEYVKYKSRLDNEAFERGTSIYFPDRVLPMLPKALSNGICSLNEREERLALSCIMKINKKGKVISGEIVKSVICSKHRMTYNEVTAICEGDMKISEKYSDVKDMILTAKKLTEILMKMRAAKGYVELDVKETNIVFNNGKIEIPEYKRTISQDMIEQFMVLANETVAEYMNSISAPFIYRIHEKPSEEKASGFKEFLKGLGVHEKLDPTNIKPYDYRKILDSLKDEPFYPIVNRVMLRSMMKAKYSPVNSGHFGLSSQCYCHFTSPIRRYPDLCIHRIIKEILDGNYEDACEKYSKFVGEASIRSSECEKRAQDAERDVDDLYCVTYMHDKIGKEYDAVISGVTSFGLFAELKNAVEGFIPIETLPSDSYKFIEGKYQLRGERHSYSIGEEISIKVAACNFDDMRTIFLLLENDNAK